MLPNAMVLAASLPQLDLSIVKLLPESTVTAPVNVLLPVNESPPDPLMVTPPLPLMTPLYEYRTLRLRLSVPLLTMLVEATLPVAPPVPRRTVPPELMVRIPVKATSASIVRVPEPAFVRPPVPLIGPVKVVLVLSPPAVSVPEPSSMVPAPAIEPTDVVLLLVSNVAPDETVTAVDDDRAPSELELNFRVPALTVVEPV